MSLLRTVQRSRQYQAICAVVGLFIVYILFFRSGSSGVDPLTNEEINSILSGDDKSNTGISRVLLDNQVLKTPYLEADLKSKNWDYMGDTLIKNNEYVRLTSQKKDQAGLLFGRNSFNDKGFEVTFKFSIHGKARINGLKGDGFGLFLTDKQLTQGTVFGSADYFKGLGVFFDTYRNAAKGPMFPYITVMNGDGLTAYDKDNDGKANELGGCSARGIYNTKNGFVDARLIHTAGDGYLSLDYNFNGEWKNCFTLSNVHIPEERFLGFSAATGDLVENHDIFEVNVYKLEQDGEPLTSYDEVAGVDSSSESPKQVEGDDDPDYEVDYKGRHRKRRSFRKKRNARQRAKLRNRLRASERRRAHLQAQRGDSTGFEFFGTLWSIIKYTFLLVIFLLVAYVAFTFYRVKMRSRRIQRKKTGIL